VTENKRIRTYVQVPDVKHPIYCFTVDVQVQA